MPRHRSLLLASVPAVIAALLVSAGPADAHGGLTFPATRTYACYVDGLQGGNGGDLNPTNPACAEAVARGGKQPLWDWFGNLIGDVGDRHRQVVADGELCGPTEKYAAYNMPRTDWPTTDVQPGATVTFRYNAWAAHPGTWTQYVTRDGWNPNQPLRWADLEQFDEVTNPPINGSGPHGAEYTWRAQLPNKRGRHIIYSVWERSDSPEAFYNCSDVHFGGSGSTPTPAPTTSTTTTAPPTTTTTAPATTTTTTAPATTTTTAPPTSTPGTTVPGSRSCEVAVEIDAAWPGGHVATVTVRNTGTSALTGWTARLGLAPGAGVAHGWGGTFAVDGASARITAMDWNASLAPGATATAGFVGSGPASPPPAPGGCTAR